MIEYNYQIKRNEEDEIALYVPDKIPKQLPNLVYIEGPNSSGKSTLLNMIALGLHGLKKENMAPALKHKMTSLLDSSYQEVTFQIRIRNRDNTLEIISTRDDPRKPIKVYEIKNGRKVPLPPERFERDYNLIYDIPENPTQRLNQLTRSIKELQQIRKNRVASLRAYIKTVINDVKHSRDPERIKTLKEELDTARREYDKLSKEHENNKNYLDMLERYTYCRCVLDYLEKLDRIEREIENLKKEQKRVERKIKKQTREHAGLTAHAQKKMNDLEEMYDRATPILRNLISEEHKHFIMLWERINFNDILRHLEFSDSFRKVLLTFKAILFNMTQDKKYDAAIEEAKIWKKVIDVLEEYETKDFVVPGIGTNISDFIRILREANKEKDELLEYVTNIDNLIALLDQMDAVYKTLETDIFPKLRKINDDPGEEWFENDVSPYDELKAAQRKFEEIQERCDFYIKECTKKDISDEELQTTFDELRLREEIHPYNSYSEEQLLEKINSLKETISEEQDVLKRKEYFLGIQEKEIERLEKKEPHKYQNKMGELTDFLRICQILEQKLVNYDKYITEIIEGCYSMDSKNSKNQDRKKYFQEVSAYLGKRVGYIRHINEEYKVRSIDMINGLINTEVGKIIRLADMGTGQSQSAYLMGQLNVTDNRKIIALFDEVAMMDKTSLTPIFKKLRELYAEDRLLLGIVVQMGQEIKIEDIEGMRI